jgi:hypothetical protein
MKAKGNTIHVPGRSMLADLSTKSHPHSRLAALRRMWSVECIEESESKEKVSEEEKPEVKVKMMRVKEPKVEMGVDEESHSREKLLEEKTLEEHGYKIGTRGNQCEADMNEVLRTIENRKIILEEDRTELTKDPCEHSPQIEAMLLKQITS